MVDFVRNIKLSIPICGLLSPKHNTVTANIMKACARWCAYGSKIDDGGGDENYYSFKANEGIISFEHDSALHNVNAVVTQGGDDILLFFKVQATYTAPGNVTIDGLDLIATHTGRTQTRDWSVVSDTQVMTIGQTYEVNWAIDFV